MDLKNPKWMYVKAALLLLIGCGCFALVLRENPTWLTAAYLAFMVWAFCRAYYFAFYVIEKYVDSDYRFAGLFSFLRYLLRKKR